MPRELAGVQEVEVSAMSTSPLLNMTDACYDTGSAEGITTEVKDFLMIDRSVIARESVSIRGPSVGTPGCEGRGPIIYRLVWGNMGLVMPSGILAETGEGKPGFRIAPAQQLKKRGIRLVGGKFDEVDEGECVRTGERFECLTRDEILVIETRGYARDLIDSPALRLKIKAIRDGLASPLIDLTDHMNEEEKAVSRESLKKIEARSLSTMVTAMILNEKKLLPVERSRLWKRRFGNCNTQIFRRMAEMPEYAGFPNLAELNEDDLIMDMAKRNRRPYPKNPPSITMNSPPWWRVWCDGYGGQKSMGGESYEGAVGGYLFVCSSTGSTDQRLYASNLQFPVALHQFLVRVEAEHWKCHVIFVDTFSVNISEDAEEVAALFQCAINPISAGSPQELAFAESKVRTVKRMSTAMMLGAPHMPANSWALADKYSVFLMDFMPQSTRGWHCPWFLRTGRAVNWGILPIYNFGAPLVYAPMDGPIHKRAAINVEGNFAGVQWPACLVKRAEDNKIMNVSKQKIRVHETAYTVSLEERVKVGKYSLEESPKENRASIFSGPSNMCDLMCDLPADETQQDGKSTLDFSSPSQEIEPRSSSELNNNEGPRPPLDKNMVQSIQSLRQHRFQLPGNRPKPGTVLEDSAAEYAENFSAVVGQGGEGLYVAECQQPAFDQLVEQITAAKKAAVSAAVKPNMREAVLSKLKDAMDALNPAAAKGRLKKGKPKKGISQHNVLKGKRKRKVAEGDVESTATPKAKDVLEEVDVVVEESSSSTMPPRRSKANNRKKTGKGGSSRNIRVRDLVSASATVFDDPNEPGSWSSVNPQRCYGIVKSITDSGKVTVQWEDKTEMAVKMRDLKREVAKATDSRIVVFLIEGSTIAYESQDKSKWPKDFFQLLIKKDWRKWVEAVKKELTGWEDNNAVQVVDISEVPSTAKVVPLGELYSIKRDGTYKYRQYLMGNLLREGIDFQETFSTTVSGPGLCTFYSLATSCMKLVHGWDAICGYLQVKEQFDVYAFLPSHQEYSGLEYEEIGELRASFLKIVAEQGEEGLRKFAKMHKRNTRSNPKQVLKCQSSIYGSPGAGHEFEMLMHSVHTKTAGMTQTQPEPSIFVRIKVDGDDKVVGYVVAMAWTDDVRMFGTEAEVAQYKKDVRSRLKVTFVEAPVAEFVSIETHQCLKTNTTELKMPRYWEKAAIAFKEYAGAGGWKPRTVPLTPYDEKILLEKPTEEEILEAKHLPFPQIVGTMSYPASNCKFELRLAVSLLGSRRGGWSKKQFDICIKVFEYGYHTREIGLMYSKGLDPHGENVLYGYADANHRVPRPQGCRIIMFNGCCICFTSKKQTLTAPSTTWAEMVTMFDCTIDILGLRNLLAELGLYQEEPTVIYQDNQSAIQIANNRGSLGKASRAMDLKTLSVRNHIEDHAVQTKWKASGEMLADMGTKALMENPFVKFRDTMNGYALVKAAYPDKVMSPLIYSGEGSWKGDSKAAAAQMVMSLDWHTVEELLHD